MSVNKYEVVIIARQDISPSQVEGLVSHFGTILGERDGKVAHHEYCGLKALAYRIRKNRKAHYLLLDIEAAPAALHEMERVMRLNEDVLRFLTVKVEKFGSRPSALMQSRYSRDDNARYSSSRDEREEDRHIEDDLAVAM